MRNSWTNEWQPDRFDIPPSATGLGAIFPTIVGELRRAKPSASIGVFHEWDGFGRLIERDAATTIVHLRDGATATNGGVVVAPSPWRRLVTASR